MKKSLIIIISLLSLFYSSGFTQGLYDINTVQKIEITFKDSNWDYRLDTAKAGSESYIMAQSVKINNIQYDSVGVKYKGNSTYSASQVKNPFHIELDTYKEQDYEGYSDIKLSNVAKDPSFVREVLSYSILRKYMAAPLSNYANVYVNGTLMGLYVSSESIGKKFVNKYFNSKSNAFFKCNPIDGAGPSTTLLPNLTYINADSTSYNTAYEMNSTYGWADLIKLIYTLNYDIANIETVLDVDKALWMLAFDNVTVNLDSYIGQFAQNYYLYKADNGRFNSILWDFNEGFGAFSATGTISLSSTSSKSQMTHTLHSGDAKWPLVQKLLGVAKYKKMYLAHMKTILDENFADNSYKTTAQAYQSVISSSVSADPNKFYTFSQFSSNLTSDISGSGPGASSVPGITTLMSARNTYLSALSDFTATKPTITSVTASNTNPIRYSTIYITAQVTNATSVYLGYRSDLYDIFSKVQMYDDGVHGDGAAGDKVYGASITVNGVSTQYYIYAESTSAACFSPARAEFEFYSIDTKYVSADVVLNEIYARGTSTDPDWVELYNTTSSAIDISGYKIYDSGGNSGSKPKKEFPTGTVIPAYGFVTIVVDDVELSGFGLSASGEKIWLENASSVVTDSVTFLTHTSTQSYARVPDGDSNWQVVNSISRNSSNQTNTAVKSTSSSSTALELKAFPNPFKQVTSLEITLPVAGLVSLNVYNSMGELVDILVYNKLSAGTHTFEWNAKNINPGIYIYKLEFNNQFKSGKLIHIK